MCARVDFPDPEGPVMHTNSPAPMRNETPSNAHTGSLPSSASNTRATCDNSIRGADPVESPGLVPPLPSFLA